MGEHADQGLSNHEDEQEGAAKSGDLDTEDVQDTKYDVASPCYSRSTQRECLSKFSPQAWPRDEADLIPLLALLLGGSMGEGGQGNARLPAWEAGDGNVEVEASLLQVENVEEGIHI